MHSLFLILSLTVPLAGEAAGPISESQLTPKGIYHAVDEHHRTGIKFYVDLKERGVSRRVPIDYGFRTGDRFTFNFEINRTSYVYVINRTLSESSTPSSTGVRRSTDELTSKRIYRVRPDNSEQKTSDNKPSREKASSREPATRPKPARVSSPAKASQEVTTAKVGQRQARPVQASSQMKPKTCVSDPRLLFPTQAAGNNNRLRENRAYGIPSRGHYVMDAEVGVEKLYVVVSDKPLNFDDYFEAKNGRVHNSRATERLAAKLADWKKNADVELVTKGIVHELEGYGVSRDPRKPAVVEIDLQHLH